MSDSFCLNKLSHYLKLLKFKYIYQSHLSVSFFFFLAFFSQEYILWLVIFPTEGQSISKWLNGKVAKLENIESPPL